MSPQHWFVAPNARYDDRSRERRGFALFVGLSETRARELGVELEAVADSLERAVTHRAPAAQTRSVAVVTSAAHDEDDLDAVIRASADAAAASQDTTETVESVEPVEPEGPTLVIDLRRHRAHSGDDDLRLTFREFALLGALATGGGRTLSRAELRRAVETDSAAEVNDRTIDVYIRRLRVKLGAHPHVIRTVHGAGYRFELAPGVTLL